MITIVSTSPGFGKHGSAPEHIARRGWKLIRCVNPAEADGGLSRHLGEADFLVVGLIPVTSGMLENANKLKGVLKHGVGVDNIDVRACTAKGLPVVNTPGANADAVAELAVGLMFALSRNIPQAHMSVTSGTWERRPGRQLGGRTLGIVGFGNIGRRLASLAKGIGMRVLATDPLAGKDIAAANGVELVDLEQLLDRADYVSLHIFGGDDNKAFLDAEKLARMKPGACLLNLARGDVVDLDAVARALDTERLGGVAIDAYVDEPPDIRHPIFSHSRAIFTPHSGADTQEAFDNMGMMVVEDIDCLLRGELPRRCLNAKDLKR